MPEERRPEQRREQRLQRLREPAGDNLVIEAGLPEERSQEPQAERQQGDRRHALAAPVPRRAAQARAHRVPARKGPAGVSASVAARAASVATTTSAPDARAAFFSKPNPASQARWRMPAKR